MNPRCHLSDLPTDQCAHCTGISLGLDMALDPRPAMPRPDGRVIWPVPDNLGDVPEPAQLPPTWLAENPDEGGCRCGRPTRNHAYLCDTCSDTLARALGDIPWTIEQLDISITGQRAATAAGGSASAARGLPWHQLAADAKRSLTKTLGTWVGWCQRTGIRSGDPRNRKPTDTAVAYSAWLLWRVDGLALHPDAPDALEQIVEAVSEARRIILWKRRTRVFLGRCDGRIDDEHAGEPCPGEVWADEGRRYGACVDCGRAYPVDERRQRIERELDSRLYTAAEIARLCVFLGLDVPRERVRNQIRAWHSRGRIHSKGEGTEGQPLFRYGDLRPLLFAQWARDTAGGA